MSSKFFVKVVRSAVEMAVVEVEADDASAAMLRAVEAAASGNSWEKVNAHGYTVHPLAAVSSEDDPEPFDALSLDEHDKFLLLHADTSGGEGEVLLEPWTSRASSLLIADVASDWVGKLEALLGDEVGSYFRDLEANTPRDNVVDFGLWAAMRRLKAAESAED